MGMLPVWAIVKTSKTTDLQPLVNALQNPEAFVYEFSLFGQGKIRFSKDKYSISIDEIALKILQPPFTSRDFKTTSLSKVDFLRRKVQAYKIGLALRLIYEKSDTFLSSHKIKEALRNCFQGDPKSEEGQRKCGNSLSPRARIFQWESENTVRASTLMRVREVTEEIIKEYSLVENDCDCIMNGLQGKVYTLSQQQMILLEQALNKQEV